jgi:long-chain fatty acid transport protein
MLKHPKAVSNSKVSFVAAALILAFCLLCPLSAMAGGLIAYEFGTQDVGLASAGYNVRAQDAATVFTNPAGMTRLDGAQILGSGQVDYSNLGFSIGSGTSPGLGNDDGGDVFGSDGLFLGGGGFFSYSVSPDLKLGFAMTGNFGAPMKYNDNWVGRYYVQEGTLVGLSFVPAIAYKVTSKLSLGGSVTAMNGIYRNKVAINNVNPRYGDGQLKMDDNAWGWGVNLGLLYEFTKETRLGFTWNSQVNLDFGAKPEFSNLAPGVQALLSRRGLMNSTIDVGINVPQQLMGSIFSQVSDRWALLGSVGWQEWSNFGQVMFGIEDTLNPTSLTQELDFKDTWHFAGGAQYRISEPWLLNFGIAYDTDFQDGSSVSPMMPANSAWRFGAGVENQVSKTFKWGVAADYLYGGTLETNLQSTLPVEVGQRGDLVGSYENIGTLFFGAYFNWTF